MRGTFYGHSPLYNIGDKVLFRDITGAKCPAEIESIIFTRDEEGEIIYMYDVVLLDETGLLFTVYEDDLEPANKNLPTVANVEESVSREVNYEEYTIDELLDAYNHFKELAKMEKRRRKKTEKYFTDKLKDIEKVLKRKATGKGKW